MNNTPEEYIEQSREKSYGTVPYAKVRAALDQIADHFVDASDALNKTEVTFEYLIGSFFPEIIQNIDAEMTRQYTLGYIDGLAARSNDNGD